MSPRNVRGLGESLEDYIEIILALEQEAGTARVRDIAERFGVSQPSVTGALRALKAKGLVRHEPYAHVTLTSAGRRAAGDVARRHRVLKDFLIRVMALPDAEADAAACRMEHVLAPAVVDRFCAFADFIHANPSGVTEWAEKIGFGSSARRRGGARARSSVREPEAADSRAPARRRSRSRRSAATPQPEGNGSC